MIAAAWRHWRLRELPLGAQIVALLLAGVVVAQVTTLVLTMLLPPQPGPKYRMAEVARALQGGPLTVHNPRPLVRVVRPQPPSLESPDWVISDQSRADLARMVGAPLTDVRILFYSPLPLSRSSGASLALSRPPAASAFADGAQLDSASHSSSTGRPTLIKASMFVLADFQASPGGGRGSGGPLGGPSGGFPGGGFPTTPDRMPTPSPQSQTYPSQTRPSSPFPSSSIPGSPLPNSSLPSSSLPSPTAPQSPVQAQTPSQPRAVTASSATADTPPAAPELRAAQTRSGAEGASPPNGTGAPGQAFPAGSQGGGPITGSVTGSVTGQTGRQAVPMSFAGQGFSPQIPARIQLPTSETPSSPVSPAQTIVPQKDELSTPSHDAAERLQPEATVPERDVTPVASADDRAAAPEPSGGFVLSPADRGGYVLPSESAPGHGLLGLPSTPYLQGDFVAAFQASPGRWVTVQPAPEPFPNTWQRRIMLWFLLSSLVVIPVGLVFARRLAAPLANFAEAAERLGRDPSGQQAPLNGPAEIGRAAHAFNEMQARLRRYIDDRTAMVGAISHDLRTPLARMRFRLERIPPQFHDGMVHDIAQMEEMITSVLAFIRDVNEPSVRDRVELRSILECVVDNASLMGGEVTLAPGERVPVDVDSLGIERVLTNLIDNALKYGDKAHVRVFQDGLDVVTEIEDEGPGLPPAELERVFLPFYRSDHSRNLNKTGIGLGLAVSRSIARAHGGDINLSSGDQGLRVQLRLPRAPITALAS